MKNIRAKQDERSWKYDRDEMVSIIFAVGMRVHAFVIKFKRLEFALTEKGSLTYSRNATARCHKNLTLHLSNRDTCYSALKSMERI